MNFLCCGGFGSARYIFVCPVCLSEVEEVVFTVVPLGVEMDMKQRVSILLWPCLLASIPKCLWLHS